MTKDLTDVYELVKLIGTGSFSYVYLGTDTSSGQEVAVKCYANEGVPEADQEYKILKLLQGCPGFPDILNEGTIRGMPTTVMALLGPNLESYFEENNRKLPTELLCSIGHQMICRIETLHRYGYVHRDVKPDNILWQDGSRQDSLYLVDFGLAKKYWHTTTQTHVSYKENRKAVGTARYASIQSSLGCEYSRRDDLESLAYVLIYLFKGSLPWQGLKAITPKMKRLYILGDKMCIPIGDLCEGMPNEFALFLESVRGLDFEQEPDYGTLKNLFSP